MPALLLTVALLLRVVGGSLSSSCNATQPEERSLLGSVSALQAASYSKRTEAGKPYAEEAYDSLSPCGGLNCDKEKDTNPDPVSSSIYQVVAPTAPPTYDPDAPAPPTPNLPDDDGSSVMVFLGNSFMQSGNTKSFAPVGVMKEMMKHKYGTARDIYYGHISGSRVSQHVAGAAGSGKMEGEGHKMIKKNIPLGYIVENDLSCLPALWKLKVGEGEETCTRNNYEDSLAFWPQMDRIAQERGARLVMQTGNSYRYGGPNKEKKDGINPWTFAEHHEFSMQGWDNYADKVKAAGRDPLVAPSAVAYRLIYRDSIDRDDPSLFSSMYLSADDWTPYVRDRQGKDDNWHPSFLGYYLIACVVYGTVTGELPKDLPYSIHQDEVEIDGKMANPTRITQDKADLMQKYAREALQMCGSLGNKRPRIPCAGLKY